jgi:hypothetical protein
VKGRPITKSDAYGLDPSIIWHHTNRYTTCVAAGNCTAEGGFTFFGYNSQWNLVTGEHDPSLLWVPDFGAGISLCNIPSEVSECSGDDLINEYSFGFRRAGISYNVEENKYCLNLGIGVGSPLNLQSM